MKKIALIMLAFVSMALVSCGGGSSDGGGGNSDGGVKPADPAITYDAAADQYRVEIRDCLQVKKVSIRENGLYKVSVTAQIEMMEEPSEPIQWIKAGVEVLDKNEAQICKETSWGGIVLEGVVHKGDVGSLSCEIETDILASKVVEDAKFVRVVSAWGRKIEKTMSYEEEKTMSYEEETEVNAYIYDADGDFTNIRNSPKGTVIDKIPCGQGRYGVYLDEESNGWWHIRDSKVYDTQTGKYRELNGDDCWIHKSIVKFTESSDENDFSFEFDYSESGSADWDKVLDEYEKFVNSYISWANKANKGDASALAESIEMMEKAEKFSSKLESAEGNMSTAQMNRLLKLENKMAEAALKAADNMENMMDNLEDLDVEDLMNNATNGLFGNDDW